LAISSFVAINGSGALSIDRWIASGNSKLSLHTPGRRRLAA
jgi:hypothetical protein